MDSHCGAPAGNDFDFRAAMMRVVNVASYLSLALAATLVGIGIYWRFIDVNPPVTVTYSHPLPLSIPAGNRKAADMASMQKVHPGQSFYRYTEYCLTRSVPGTVQSYLLSLDDGAVISLTSRETIGAEGCFQRSFREVVPAITPPGKYEHRIYVTYRLNPLTEVRYDGIKVYLDVVQE